MHQESMFNTSAKSNQGAVGLMQVLPSTAKFITSSKDVKRNNSNILKIPEINLEVGQEYIEYLLDLEREAFLSLCSERKTLERIQHILKTGKPLRN